MKARKVIIQLLGIFMLVLMGGPLAMIHLDPVTPANAMGYIPRHYRHLDTNGGTYQTPEPSVLVMLGTGMGGVGLLYGFARRNRKK